MNQVNWFNLFSNSDLYIVPLIKAWRCIGGNIILIVGIPMKQTVW